MSNYASDNIFLPWYFWLALAVVLGLVLEACLRIRKVWAIPALLVYGTIAAWYLGDIVQTGAGDFLSVFGPDLTQLAMWQVILFLVAYRLFIYKMVPQKDDPRIQTSVAHKLQEAELRGLFGILFVAWLIVFAIGMVIVKGDVLAIIWPPSSGDSKVSMFSRPGIGSGADSLLSTGGYVYVLISALFGVLFVLGRGPVRGVNFAMMLLTWPYFLFDRARSGMLTLIMPLIFSYLISTWGGWLKKAIVCTVALAAIYFWFGQVMHYRDADTGGYRVNALLELSHEKQEQLGLDMLKELCYVDHFVATGEYNPNWGQRYYAEAVGFVPRTLWPGKPLPGYDYAYARGYRDDTTNGDAVYATISTGMIGQGITNFGRFFGVVAAAFLMALWTLILAKLWQRRFELPRFLLLLVGCGVTFNLGRDITLLVLWPFVFGYGLVLWYEWVQKRAPLARRTRRLVDGAPRPGITPRPVIARGQP